MVRTSTQTEVKLLANRLARVNRLFDEESYSAYINSEPVSPDCLGNGSVVTQKRYFGSIEHHRKEIDRMAMHGGTLNELLRTKEAIDNLVDAWTEDNKGLVYTGIKIMKVPYNDIEDAVQEGWFSLYKTTIAFDFTRGFRFATYSMTCIIRAIMRNSVLSNKRRPIPFSHFGDETEFMHPAYNNPKLLQDDTSLRVEAMEGLLKEKEGGLTEREIEVVLRRFPTDQREPETLSIVGMRFGVSKERIRQIQNNALKILREGIEERVEC